jgi:hypothetical protein
MEGKTGREGKERIRKEEKEGRKEERKGNTHFKMVCPVKAGKGLSGKRIYNLRFSIII